MQLKHLLSSFSIKLFIGFWLIAIFSIFSTRLISEQFLLEANKNIEVKTANLEDLRKLVFITRRIKRSNIKIPDDFLHLREIIRPNVNVWFQAIDINGKNITSQKIVSIAPLKPKYQKSVVNFINNNAFEKKMTALFSYTRLTGPLKISLNNQHYRIFISHQQKNKHIWKFLQHLPPWARLLTPLIISFILCWLLARSLSKPLIAIKKSALKLGKGDFSTRIKHITHRNDEMGELAITFNQMAEKLEQNSSAQQRLLGDVSHELRSPLTRLQMALGLAQESSISEQSRVQYLQRCELEIGRLDKMIGDVLALSRLENTVHNLQLNTIDFKVLLSNIIEDEQFIANEKSIIITLDSLHSIEILADTSLLSSAISNIIGNAVKYSPENSRITITLTQQKQQLILTVSDEGVGVPEQALTQLFEPFYRVNLARDRQTGGTGLGLAIAKQAIIAHQGKIYATNNLSNSNALNKNSGLTVTIELPLL